MQLAFPPSWTVTLGHIARGLAKRVVVIGPTDVGKSTFIQATESAAVAVGSRIQLLDLDPGQKMLGPPGTVGLGSDGRIERLIFVGSTSASEVSQIVRAAGLLAQSARGRFIVNTAGFVRGLGARLQSATIAALQPDLIVVIGDVAALADIVDANPGIVVARLERPAAATRKSPARRARARQAALAAALDGAEPLRLQTRDLSFVPAPPIGFTSAVRPVCAIETADGDVAALGVVGEFADETVVFARQGAWPTNVLRLGKMWAQLTPAGWELLEQLAPAWQQLHLPSRGSPGSG